MGRAEEFVLILREQVESWKVVGNEIRTESLLERYPWLRDDPEHGCLLILSERNLCQERSRSIEDDLLNRFPEHRTALEMLFGSEETDGLGGVDRQASLAAAASRFAVPGADGGATATETSSPRRASAVPHPAAPRRGRPG